MRPSEKPHCWNNILLGVLQNFKYLFKNNIWKLYNFLKIRRFYAERFSARISLSPKIFQRVDRSLTKETGKRWLKSNISDNDLMFVTFYSGSLIFAWFFLLQHFLNISIFFLFFLYSFLYNIKCALLKIKCLCRNLRAVFFLV